MLRALILTLSLGLVGAGTAQATDDYQDWWWNSSQSGMGFNIGHQGDTVFVAWFLYDAAGSASFLTMAGSLANGQASGTLYRNTGPLPGPGYDPAAVNSVAVGTASVSFNSSNSGTFSYDYDGRSGSIGIQRFSFGPQSFDGNWEFASKGSVSGCTDSSENGAYTASGLAVVDQSGNSATVTTFYDDGYSCTYTLTLSQKGSYSDGSGTISCNNGVGGTVQLSRLRKIDDFLTFQYDARATSGETCRDQAKVGAVK